MSTKKFSLFGPAVWLAIGNIYTNVLFYYILDKINKFFIIFHNISYYLKNIYIKGVVIMIGINKYTF